MKNKMPVAMEMQITFICLLVGTLNIVTATHAAFGTERQRYDGWFNNLANQRWGTRGCHLLNTVPQSYDDYTYQPSGQGRPAARDISNAVFNGSSGQPSYNNLTALMAFFGQLVTYEITYSSMPTCPVELVKVPIPKCDQDFDPKCSGREMMPFYRAAYDKRTGRSPNNPRKQINEVTSWIDGSFLYGTQEVWANCLRAMHDGRLKSVNGSREEEFPAMNHIRLPLDNFPSPHKHKLSDPETKWMFGHPRTHMHPGLTALGIVWFRWHNYMADRFTSMMNTTWADEVMFHKTRRWVIATMQNIIMYEWLPTLLNETIPEYTGYKNYIQPGVTAAFHAAASRYLITLIPPGLYRRNDQCEFNKGGNFTKPWRLCNSYFESQDLLESYHGALDELLMGMASQIAEREDTVVVDDVRDKSPGPLHFSRHDVVVQTIMRGRDFGLGNYNSARRAFGLEEVDTWDALESLVNTTTAEEKETVKQTVEKLRNVYNGSMEHLDVFAGGMAETGRYGPGPLFREILLDQFLRIRDADRYWFENKQNGLFTDDEIAQIKSIKFADIITNVTNIEPDWLQRDVFLWQQGDPCPQEKQLVIEDMEPCTDLQGWDYFAGSELWFIGSLVVLGLVPFFCILVAYLIYRVKKFRTKRVKRTLHMDKLRSMVRANAGNIAATEWTDPKDLPRSIELHFDDMTCGLLVLTASGTKIRHLDFSMSEEVNVWLSMNRGKETMLIQIPNEYDLVVMFDDEEDRMEFLRKFKSYLNDFNKNLQFFHDKQQNILENAVTKRKRQQLLERFFKTVFAEALTLDHQPRMETEAIEQGTAKEILNLELSKAEFAEALALKPSSLFVEQFFSMLDKDQNGYISFREFLYAVVLFSKGSCEDKLHMLFRMYDLNHSGSLNKEEIAALLRSLLEMANTDLTADEVDKLTETMFVNSGLEGKGSLRFEEFQQLLADDMTKLWDVCIDWKGTKVCFPKKRSNVDKEKVKFGNTGQDAFGATREKYHPIGAKMKNVLHFIENNRQHIFYLIIFYGICIGLFSERFYTYSVEKEHFGLRRIASYGVPVSRGSAAALTFCYSLILLTVCRNLITRLRETFLNLYIPFDSNVAFHKVIAWTALFFTLAHVVGHALNFYHISTQPVQHLCIFDEIFFKSEYLPTFAWWLLGTLTGMTGVLVTIVIFVIYIFATQCARQFIFNAFWATHKLIIPMYILTILHGSGRLLQLPYFWAYFVGPAILFTIDKLVSISRRKMEISVINAELLPSDVTFLEFKRPPNFEYKSGQWVRIACLSQGRHEYHPFTLTSAPQEDTLSLHIRAIGPWTWNLRNLYDPDMLRDGPYPKLFLDGPYGSGHQDWYQYDVSILVGGGIGVTPFASILKDFVHMSTIKNTFKIKCQKLYFIWVTASQRHYEWLIDILRQVEEVDKNGLVNIHIFITQFFQKFDLRTAMLYICEEHFTKVSGKSLFTGLRAKTHFGRPQFEKIFQSVQETSKVTKVGVFSCGPPGLTKGVEKACIESSKHSKALFEHHYENF